MLLQNLSGPLGLKINMLQSGGVREDSHLQEKSKDLHPNGKWVYTMHGPDGVDYPNITTYHEVIPYKKLVYDHGATEKN